MTNRNAGLALLDLLLVAAGQALAADKQKTLSVDGQNNHNWPATTPLIKRALEESGLFTVEVATSPAGGKDLSALAPKFSDYQVVVSNYNGDLWSESTRQALVDYVRGGGGLEVVHIESPKQVNAVY